MRYDYEYLTTEEKPSVWSWLGPLLVAGFFATMLGLPVGVMLEERKHRREVTLLQYQLDLYKNVCNLPKIGDNP